MRKVHACLITGFLTTLATIFIACPITILIQKIDFNKNMSKFTNQEIKICAEKARKENQEILNSIICENDLTKYNEAKYRNREDMEREYIKLINEYYKISADEQISWFLTRLKTDNMINLNNFLPHFINPAWIKNEVYDTLVKRGKADYLYIKNNGIYINKLDMFYSKKVEKPYFYYEIIIDELTKATRWDVKIYQFSCISITDFKYKN